MKRFLSLAGLLAVLALSACGGDEEGAPASTEAASAGAFPVTIESALGSATIERAPERVVTLDNQATDDVLALGVTPVGIAAVTYVDGDMQTWTKDALGAERPEMINVDAAVPYEKIAALRPDLILAPHLYLVDQRVFDRLSRIAPTVASEKTYLEDGWQQTARRIGQALGRSGRAEELIAQAEAGLAEARERTPQFEGATVNIFNATASGVYTINSPDDYSLRLMADLGMRLSPEVEKLKGEYGRAVISAERYDLLDSDLLIGTSGDSPAVLEKLERDRLFGRLGAVRQGRYVGLPIGDGTSMAFPSVLSVPYATREVVPQLERALQEAV